MLWPHLVIQAFHKHEIPVITLVWAKHTSEVYAKYPDACILEFSPADTHDAAVAFSDQFKLLCDNQTIKTETLP